jgi:hypothetical protein
MGRGPSKGTLSRPKVKTTCPTRQSQTAATKTVSNYSAWEWVTLNLCQNRVTTAMSNM